MNANFIILSIIIIGVIIAIITLTVTLISAVRKRNQPALSETINFNKTKGQIRSKTRWDFSSRTLWDWLQLLGVLVIPILVAISSIFFIQAQNNDLIAVAQQQQEQATLRDQQREIRLQTYLDQMSELIINNHLTDPNSPASIRSLARARTLTALLGLDPSRKRIIVQFLYNANLINRKPVVDLSEADLSNADLSKINLIDADLANANLANANLTNANLANANLTNANLTNANLTNANLTNANLTNANLRGANPTGVYFNGANLRGADLRGAIITQSQLDEVFSCSGAILPQGLTCPFDSFNNGIGGWGIIGGDVSYAQDNGNGVLRFNPPDQGPAEAYKSVGSAALSNFRGISLRINLHGATLVAPSDDSNYQIASALYLDQNGWKLVGLYNYIKNSYDGWQNVYIPLTDFTGFDKTASFSRLGFRFWLYKAGTIDIDDIAFVS